MPEVRQRRDYFQTGLPRLILSSLVRAPVPAPTAAPIAAPCTGAPTIKPPTAPTPAPIRATERGRAEEKRDPFTIRQLQIIFDAPIYKGCQSSSKWNRTGNFLVKDTRYWMPVLGLYSGMRLGELLSLQRRDVLQEEGVHYFNIRRAKTDAGVRKVPVHPELIRCGLMTYIDNLTDNQPLFGDCSQKAYSKFFRRFQKSIGLDDPKLVFHSFRHSFTDGLRSARIEEPIAKVLLGHSDGSVTSRYGSGYAIGILNEAISAVKFKDLKIAHMYE